MLLFDIFLFYIYQEPYGGINTKPGCQKGQTLQSEAVKFVEYLGDHQGNSEGRNMLRQQIF